MSNILLSIVSYPHRPEINLGASNCLHQRMLEALLKVHSRQQVRPQEPLNNSAALQPNRKSSLLVILKLKPGAGRPYLRQRACNLIIGHEGSGRPSPKESPGHNPNRNDLSTVNHDARNTEAPLSNAVLHSGKGAKRSFQGMDNPGRLN